MVVSDVDSADVADVVVSAAAITNTAADAVRPLDSPPRSMVCRPTGVSSGIVTVPLKAPRSSARNVASTIGALCSTTSTCSPAANPAPATCSDWPCRSTAGSDWPGSSMVAVAAGVDGVDRDDGEMPEVLTILTYGELGRGLGLGQCVCRKLDGDAVLVDGDEREGARGEGIA